LVHAGVYVILRKFVNPWSRLARFMPMKISVSAATLFAVNVKRKRYVNARGVEKLNKNYDPQRNFSRLLESQWMTNKSIKKSLSLGMLIAEVEAATDASPSWVSNGNIYWIANHTAISTTGVCETFVTNLVSSACSHNFTIEHGREYGARRIPCRLFGRLVPRTSPINPRPRSSDLVALVGILPRLLQLSLALSYLHLSLSLPTSPCIPPISRRALHHSSPRAHRNTNCSVACRATDE
jgi:hypothetical protein